MADEKSPVCAVVGVGPGNGEALARRFAADGYALALMARRTDLTTKLASKLKRAKSYACDVAEAASVEVAFAAAPISARSTRSSIMPALAPGATSRRSRRRIWSAPGASTRSASF